MQNNTKSSAVAGILGVFLGAFGGHDWYLGNTKKAITHVSLTIGGFLLLMIGIIIDNLTSGVVALNILFKCLIIASYVIIIGNFVWGFIEGVIIIAQGDAGLAAKGYKVADPATTTMTIANPSANAAATPAPAAGAPAPAAEGAANTPASTSPASSASQTPEAPTSTTPVAASDNSTASPAKAEDQSKAPEPPLKPAHLDNIITATPAASGIMQASVPMGNTASATSTPVADTNAASVPTNTPSVAPTAPEAPAAPATPITAESPAEPAPVATPSAAPSPAEPVAPSATPATPDTALTSSTPNPTDSNPTTTPPSPVA